MTTFAYSSAYTFTQWLPTYVYDVLDTYKGTREEGLFPAGGRGGDVGGLRPPHTFMAFN